MANNYDPKYDTDYVTLRYLNKTINGENKNVDKKIGTLPKSYGVPPVPPYYKGSLLAYQGKIYKCLVDKEIGVFDWRDWELTATDDTNLNNFVENTYSIDKLQLQEQIDGKVESYYQDQDPSTSWTTDLLKSKHTGDYWYKTSDHTQWRYCKILTNPITYSWQQVDVPMSVYNQINGKKSIYLSKPTSYKQNDMWIIEEDISEEDIPPGEEENPVKKGDWVFSVRDSNTYNKNDWIKKDNDVDVEYLQEHYYTIEESENIFTTESYVDSAINSSKDEIELEVEQNYTKKETTEYIVNDFDTKIGNITNTVTEQGRTLSNVSVEVGRISQSVVETTTRVEDLEEIVDKFAVDLDIYSLTIPTNVDQYPLETKNYLIGFVSKYKGQVVTPQITFLNQITGISRSHSGTNITVGVNINTLIPNVNNELSIKFSYTDGTEIIDLTKKIIITLAKQGLDGEIGPQGPQGATGAQGPAGEKGDKGDTGEQGPQGETGAKGDTGATGPQGPQGIQGPKGDNGESYYTWIKYADTPTSGMSDNPTGKDYIGIAYNKSTPTESTSYSDYSWSLIKGEDGAQGPKGDTGAQGPKGDTGEKGDKGETGATGSQGPKGDTGATGNGIQKIEYFYARSTTQTAPSAASITSTTIPSLDSTNKYLWQKEVITYTSTSTQQITVLLIAVYGDTGATGSQGPKGDTGEQGPKGDTGATGSQGPKGDTGAKGDKGDTGAKGDKGDTGTQGPAGKDAAIQSATPPEDTSQLWYDTVNDQLKRYNGTDWIIANDYEEDFNTLDNKIGEANSSIGGLKTNLENNYSNNEELEQKFSNQKNVITMEYQTWVNQQKDGWEYNVLNSITENGVTKLSNTLVVIDIDGIKVAVNTSDFNTLLNNMGLYMKDGNTLVSKVDKDGFLANNIENTGRYKTSLTMTECITDENGEECEATFWIGD